MKHMMTRMAALAVLLCLIISCALQGNYAAATAEEGAAEVHIPFGEDVSGYAPDKDGYYGLLPIQYEAAQSEDGQKTMEKAYMPVLVSDGHLYISDSEIQSVLGLTVKKGGSTLLISAFERNLALGGGNKEAQFFAGDFNNSYISLTVELSAAPIYYNKSVWVPLQDISVIFDLGLHQEADGEDVFITVYDPDETVIDVLAYLYNNSGDCMTAYTSGDMALLSGESAAAQIAAKMIDGDATAWAAVALSTVGFDEKGYELLIKQLADDMTLDLMCVIPDESLTVAKESANRMSDLANLVSAGLDTGANAAVDMDIMDAVLEARVSSSSIVNDPYWFSEALDRINLLTEQKNTLKQLNAGFDGALTGVNTVFGMLQTAATYESVDEISAGGVGAICANRKYLNYSDPVVLDEIESYCAFMQSGEINYSLYDYISKNAGSWVIDGISASCPVFKLIQLSTHLVPAIADGVDATHSFQISMLAIPLQSDVERLLQAELKAYPARKADATQFKALSETAYIYLKTCYIAKNQASSALYLEGDVLAQQQAQMDFLLEKMAILSVNYNITPENTYSKCYRLRELDDAALIDNYVDKMYLQVSGAVLKAEDESPVSDAHCEIVNRDGEACGYFDGTPDGKYAEVYVPLYEPAGCIPYDSGLLVSATMNFSSPTVEGADTVRAEAVPGTEVDPVDTAYLATGGFAIASTMGAIDGVLYSVTTRHIDAGEGIMELNVPVDEANGFYAAKFAYCGGKIYFIEKTTGTDETVDFRLCRCNKDGSGRTVLVDIDDISWSGLYFVVENGYITWEQYNGGTGTTSYMTYGISEGNTVNAETTAIPLTELVLGGYDGSAVMLEQNSDDTWTLYRRLLNNEDEESLSYSIVTIDDAGNTNVTYKGMKGYIEGVRSIFAVYNGYAYMSAYENSNGILYKLNLNDANDVRIIGSHMAAGGGDAFFNY